MRKIIINDNKDTIPFYNVNTQNPIFAKKGGKFVGMLVEDDGRWILKIGGDCGATGYHDIVKACIESCLPYGYEFYVN